MAFATTGDGTRIHYDVLGRPGADTVLFLPGLGVDKRSWTLQRLALSWRYRTIALDTRGTGRSDKPFGRYSVDDLVDDAVAVLDAAGVDAAHVVGSSLGGVVAQVLAVRHPERVRSLVLVATACRHHPWREELLADWASTALEQGVRAMTRRNLRWLVGPRSRRRLPGACRLVGPLGVHAPDHAFAAQVRALLDVDDVGRWELRRLRVPTAVVVGSQDVLTPRGDAEELAELIPGAELVVVSGAAHGLAVEHAGELSRVLLGFLARVERERCAL